MIMRWCNVQTSEHDQQAKTYPTIFSHHKLHNNNENKIPVFPGRLLPLDMKKEQLMQYTPPLNTKFYKISAKEAQAIRN